MTASSTVAPRPDETRTRMFHDRSLWLLILVSLLFFIRPLLSGETFFYRDLTMHFYPQKLRFVQLLKTEGLPLWDPYLHGGQPFLADPNNIALYPTNLLYLILPPVRAFNFDIVLHIMLAAVIAYLLVRSLGFGQAAAFAGGAIYAFCGFTLSLVNVWMLVSPYLPLLVLAWHRYSTGSRRAWFGIAVAAGCLQVLAGRPEVVLLSLLILLAWTVSYPYGRPVGRRIACWAVLAGLIAGICLVQLVPAWEMLRNSSRSHGLDFQAFAAWSVHPKRLPEMLIPRFLGYTDRLHVADYWGARLESQFPYILSIYFGLPVILLALYGAIGGKATGLPRTTRFMLLAVAVLSILSSLGGHLPGLQRLYSHLPLLPLLRYPVKLLFAAVLPIALLAANGLSACLSLNKPGRLIRAGAWVLFGLLFVLTAVFRFSPSFASAFQQYFFGTVGDTAQSGLTASFMRATATWFLMTLYLQFAGRKAAWVPAAVIALDLLWNGLAVNPYAPAELLTAQPALVSDVKSVAAGGRFFRVPDRKGTVYPVAANRVSYVAYWNNRTLNNYQAALYSIPVVFHEDYDGLAPARSSRLAAVIQRLPWQSRLPALSAASVTAIASTERLDVPGLENTDILGFGGPLRVWLYKNQRPVPPLLFVAASIHASSAEQALQLLTSPGFDPRQKVIVEEERRGLQGGGSPADVKIVKASALKTEVTTETGVPGYLVFSEPRYPGWKVTVDGEAVKQVAANYAYSAVFLKAGKHVVIRRYFPASLAIGAAGSLLSLALLLWFFRRRQEEQAG